MTSKITIELVALSFWRHFSLTDPGQKDESRSVSTQLNAFFRARLGRVGCAYRAPNAEERCAAAAALCVHERGFCM